MPKIRKKSARAASMARRRRSMNTGRQARGEDRKMNGGVVRTASGISRSRALRGDAKLERADGWANVLTGLGVLGLDKRRHTNFDTAPILGEGELADLYRGNGFGRRIVDLPAREMLRRGFEIDGDTDRKVMSLFEEKGLMKQVGGLIRWSRLYGGALGVLGLVDGGKLDQPLNEKRIQRLDFMHVYDRFRVTWTSQDLYLDPMNPKFGQPEFYTVSPYHGGLSFKVHESRTVRMDGVPLPDRDRRANQGWGDSILQTCFEELRQMGAVYAAVEYVVDDFVIGKLKVKDLAAKLEDAAGEQKIINRLHTFDMTKSMLNTVAVDQEYEDYEKVTSSITGLPDTLDRFAQALAAVIGWPVTVLMGRSPAGMNSTGDNDTRMFYDGLSADQAENVTPVVDRIVHLLWTSKETGAGAPPADWQVKWKPLWEPTEKEQADTNKVKTDEVKALKDMGAISADEVRQFPHIQLRFNLKGKAPEPPPDPSIELERQKQEAAARAAGGKEGGAV